MEDVVLQGVRTGIVPYNKDEGDESLPLLAFQRDVVSEIFCNIQRRQIILESLRNLKYPFRSFL